MVLVAKHIQPDTNDAITVCRMRQGAKIEAKGARAVQLEGVVYPHDFAFATLPPEYVNGSTPIVVYVTETPPADAAPAKVHRFVLRAEGDGWSAKAQRAPAEPLPLLGNVRPPTYGQHAGKGNAPRTGPTSGSQRTGASEHRAQPSDPVSSATSVPGHNAAMRPEQPAGSGSYLLQIAVASILFIAVAGALYYRTLAGPGRGGGAPYQRVVLMTDLERDRQATNGSR
jgi:hypothetical protein